ncbi:MAG: hypothetical protein ACPLSO_00310 [Fervidicoccaceae archaeon]
MGRTVPSSRMAIEPEIEKLMKMIEYIHEPEVKRALKEIVEAYADIAPVFRAVPPYDKTYAILLAGLLRTMKRLEVIEQKLDIKG